MQALSHTRPAPPPAWPRTAAEAEQVDWLMACFNHTFSDSNTVLVRGGEEPEYLAATRWHPARIKFAHGYFASALHEISHWTIAGSARRRLDDLGYWYAPDGRTAEQQRLFERVEVRPQAVEWLLTRACLRSFRVSLDNLTGEAGSGGSFKDAVYAQVHTMLAHPATIPRDARRLLRVFSHLIRDDVPLATGEFCRTHL